METRNVAASVVVALGALIAAYGLYLAVSPMLLEAEHTAPLGSAATAPAVRDLLAFGSFQIAALSFAWGILVAGLAPAAIRRGDLGAYAALWLGGVGAGAATVYRMVAIGDVEGALWSAIPVVVLAGALFTALGAVIDSGRRLPVASPGAPAREREEPLRKA